LIKSFFAELCIHMLCVWRHHQKGGVAVSAGRNM